MILVLLGTQNNDFHRLLEKVDKNIKNENIKEEVVVQAGFTKYKSDNMKIFSMIPIEEMDELIKNCNYVISHGGVGSIIKALKYDKKVIAVARLSTFGEHVNDHQLDIIKMFKKKEFIIGLEDVDELDEAIKKIDKFKPKKYESNTKNIIKIVEDFIDNC